MNKLLVAPITVEEFLQREIPPAKSLLGNWLEEGMPVLIAGEAGIGKSHFVYWLASAVAQGGEFLAWDAPEALPVGLLDGEMRDSTITSRLASIVASTGFDGKNLRLVSRDMFIHSRQLVPCLRSPEDCERVLDLFTGVKLLVVDNLNCFFAGGDENSSSFWDDVERFNLACRDRGMTLLMVHHASKTNKGSPAGNSKNVRVPEVVIVLTAIEDASEGSAEFMVEFQKTRVQLTESKRFHVQLVQLEDGTATWTLNATQRDELTSRIRHMNEDGMSLRKIGEQTGMSHQTVSRILKKAPTQQSIF